MQGRRELPGWVGMALVGVLGLVAIACDDGPDAVVGESPTRVAEATPELVPTEVPTVPVVVATAVDRLPRSEDTQLFARRHRAGEDEGETLEIRREELLIIQDRGRSPVCEVVPLDAAGRELIWDSEVWSGWDPTAVPSHDPVPGSWIWSVEVTYQGQTWRTVYETDGLDEGPVRHAILTANDLWDRELAKPCPPTPSLG